LRHLGLTRSSSDENRINIEERIALARRTLYSLIKTGVHGTIGNVPNNRYTAEFAVLIGRDCRRFSVPIWKLERVAISFFFRFIKTEGKRKIDRVAEKQNELKHGDTTLHFKSETPHLGLTRSSSDENRINIEDKMFV
jgi:hypothetical protein